MNTEWQEFLDSQPAPATASDLATDVNQLPGKVTALPSMGVVTVTGADAGEFLQAHFTNDVMAVEDGLAQLSGYCSPKGRLLALFYLLKKSDAFILLMPRDVVEPVLKRLGMFAQMARPAEKQTIGKVTRTDVQLTDASDEIMAMGLVSDHSGGALSSSIATTLDTGVLPADTSGAVIHSSDVSLVRVSSAKPEAGARWICIGSPAALKVFWAAVIPVANHITEDVWLLEDIRAGVPSVVLATQDMLVPQMANLHLLDGVSFTKGCYPGQEIVARMQYLGKLKRRTERFVYHGAPVLPGTDVLAEGVAGAGLVVSAAYANENESEALVMIKISALGQALKLADSDGPLLQHLPLPYEVAHEDKESG